ncbi:filamentous hemagglutinin N-terminal domain-containing protein [Luteolibacter arcticus]|uniref:Filamentous hemagglutinin N-terminal domain-containing protein n=1 Tax=Luteolibacter arcticus TaxID=1581411 RepID=A0ABT3GNV4_9BACT|nr:filamentous hemagglutinin N-terminal domain-containing protein [Luteolibacter arcticus]MCW1925192.1 filamentous hemagglutinin N-terminal domain-containing protein [Luteolibacter arcticus]
MALENMDGLGRLAILALAATTVPLTADVTFDGTMTPGNIKPPVPINGKNYQIPHTLGTTAGKNLFHSFDQFSLDSGYSATFTGPAGLKNVIARVTGGHTSQINGAILSDIQGADVYLINPSGIMFGQGASVNVKGAFTATTADYLSFCDPKTGAELCRFWASRDRALTLSCAAPSRFGFLPSTSPGAIEFRLANYGTGSAFSQNSFSAVGKSIEAIDSRFRRGTDVSLQALNCGEVALNGTIHPIGAQHPQAGDITFSHVFVSNASGSTLSLRAGGNLKIHSDSVFTAGSGDGSKPGGVFLQSGGDISISDSEIAYAHRGSDLAGRVEVTAGGNLTLEDSSTISSFIEGLGSGPKINLSAGSDLLIQGGSAVISDASSGATGGDISICAAGRIHLSGSGSVVSFAGDSRGGDIHVDARKGLWLSDSGLLQSSATGDATGGDLIIESGGTTRIEGFSLIQSFAGPFAQGGLIDLKTKHLWIDGPQQAVNAKEDRSVGLESVIDAKPGNAPPNDNVPSPGKGGKILVHASGDISISNSGGIFSSTNGPGTSGSIQVTSSSLKITGGRNYLPGEEAIRPRNFFITGISNKSSPNSTGDVGAIDVQVDGEIRLLRGGFIDATTFSDSDSGDVTVTAKSIEAHRGGSDYFTGIGAGTVADDDEETDNGGRGANVKVNAGSIRLLNGAQITASSRGSGDAGSVRVNVRQLYASGVGTETPFLFTGESGIAAATIGAGSGTGGDVYVSGRNIRILNGASISSTNRSPAPNGGFAGSVILDPTRLIVDGGRIEVSSAAGNAGELRIEGGSLLDFRNAEIVAEADNEGGDIVISKAWNVLLDHSRVSANAERGDGGSIQIGSASFLSNQSTVTASSQFAADGQVSIDSQAALSGAEGQLEIAPIDVTDSLQPECTDWIDANGGSAPGSFIRSGRGGAARLPGGYLPSLRLHRTD